MRPKESMQVTSQQSKSLREWGAGDIRRFFNLDLSTWCDFRDNQLASFFNQHIKYSRWYRYFDRNSIARDQNFLCFEQDVLVTCPWASADGVDRT